MTMAFNDANLLSGDFWIRIRSRPEVDLDRMQAAVDEEIARLAQTAPTQEELDRVINGRVTRFVSNLETVEGKADQLNDYLYFTGSPDFAEQDLARYRALTPADIQRVARQYLAGRNHAIISIVPQGKTELAAQENQ
jgi:zinc protease